MSHRHAVALMLLVTLLWSTAGVVSRHLEAARSFEVTFWRSAFNALALIVALASMQGRALWGQVLRAPRKVWASALCWAVMYTAFMLAITMTSVANVLVTMSLGPLLTALFARLFLRHRLPARTWGAILLGSAGIAWMFGHELQGGLASLAGMGVALGVPIAAATNWTLLQHDSKQAGDERSDMLLAVLLGALISAACTLPLAWPLVASAHDLTLLAGLGLFQLALPCLLVVRLARVLSGPELALLGLLEVVFGVLWAWLGAGEAPSSAALVGGAMVLAALAGNELLGWRGRSPATPLTR
ncbi:DMT family transporter [Paucibacter soli]|uniref:DMT family transporter n=1 Tax=Paucibacter soli TaxID=3133433 RepID=UPI0030A91993